MGAIERASLGFDFLESRFEILSRNLAVKFQTIFAPDFTVGWWRGGEGRSDRCAIKGAIPEQTMRKAEAPRGVRNLFTFVTKEIAIKHRCDGILLEAFGAPTQPGSNRIW